MRMPAHRTGGSAAKGTGMKRPHPALSRAEPTTGHRAGWPNPVRAHTEVLVRISRRRAERRSRYHLATDCRARCPIVPPIEIEEPAMTAPQTGLLPIRAQVRAAVERAWDAAIDAG